MYYYNGSRIFKAIRIDSISLGVYLRKGTNIICVLMHVSHSSCGGMQA